MTIKHNMFWTVSEIYLRTGLKLVLHLQPSPQVLLWLTYITLFGPSVHRHRKYINQYSTLRWNRDEDSTARSIMKCWIKQNPPTEHSLTRRIRISGCWSQPVQTDTSLEINIYFLASDASTGFLYSRCLAISVITRNKPFK